MVFSMNVFKNKNGGKIKNVKKRKKRALNKKRKKRFFYIYDFSDYSIDRFVVDPPDMISDHSLITCCLSYRRPPAVYSQSVQLENCR